MKVGDLVRWDYQQYGEDGVSTDGALFGLILEVADSVSSEPQKCYRVAFHDEDVFGNIYQADQWMYGCEVIKMNKT